MHRVEAAEVMPLPNDDRTLSNIQGLQVQVTRRSLQGSMDRQGTDHLVNGEHL